MLRVILSTNQQPVFPRAGGATCWTLAPEVPCAPIKSQLSSSGKSPAFMLGPAGLGLINMALSRVVRITRSGETD